MPRPKLGAMNSVPQEGLMDIHQMHERVPCSTPANHVVVSSHNLFSVLPSGQSRLFGITDAVREIKNIGQENMAASRKVAVDLVNHSFQALIEIGDPRCGLIPRGPEHRSF